MTPAAPNNYARSDVSGIPLRGAAPFSSLRPTTFTTFIQAKTSDNFRTNCETNALIALRLSNATFTRHVMARFTTETSFSPGAAARLKDRQLPRAASASIHP